MPYADWYKVRAENFACNQHPRASKVLVKSFAEHLCISEIQARHLLDRLRHLAYCLDEPDAITLLRLQPGTKQKPVDRSVTDL